MRHPMQPVVLVDGIPRFKQNAIVRYLLDLCQVKGSADMNTLALIPFSQEDHEQFAQLIGYSVSGAGGLSYMRKALIDRADVEAAELMAINKCRNPCCKQVAGHPPGCDICGCEP